MKTKTTDRTVDQAIAAIQALDLDPIRFRVMDKESGEGWTRDYAETIEQAYRAYLTMLVKHPEDAEDIVVSKDVDEFWHAHILHTMKYTEDCEKVFGSYLHHNPHVGERTQADIERKASQAEKTRRLYDEEFGARYRDTAWCGATLESKDASWCGAGIRTSKAAGVELDNAGGVGRVERRFVVWRGIKTNKAAWCGASIKPAVWSGVEGRLVWRRHQDKQGGLAWSLDKAGLVWGGVERRFVVWRRHQDKQGGLAWSCDKPPLVRGSH
jgi:hypothetical protein